MHKNSLYLLLFNIKIEQSSYFYYLMILGISRKTITAVAIDIALICKKQPDVPARTCIVITMRVELACIEERH